MNTPRTNAEALRFARIMVEWPEPGEARTTELIPADFARQLETECTTLLELLEEFVRIDDEDCAGLKCYSASDLVLALDAARDAIARLTPNPLTHPAESKRR